MSMGSGKESRDSNRTTFVHEARADAPDETDAARKQHEVERERERLARMRADQALAEELARVQEEEQRLRTREFLAKAKVELSRHAEDEEELMPWEITANRLAEEAKERRAAAERAAAEQRAREERAAAAATKAAAERAQRHAELEAEKQARLEAEREEASSQARLKAEKEKAAAARAAERAAAQMAAQEKVAADRAAACKLQEADKESNAAAYAADREEAEAEGAHGAQPTEAVEVEVEVDVDVETGAHGMVRSARRRRVLPPGWREHLHHANSKNYHTFHGPNGEKARSIPEAIRMHAAANGQWDDLIGRVAAKPIRNTLCVWCGGDSRSGHELLLCDTAGCNQAWHLACLEEPLQEPLPEGNWFCPYCEDAADLARGPRPHLLDAATLYARCELAVAGKCPDLDGVRWRLATPDELPSGTALGMLGEPLPGQPRNAPVLLVPAPLPLPADASALPPLQAVSAASASALPQRRFTAEELAQLLEV
jgi:multidrug efflux pump subunit AcrA (membrane-fusion protein)